MNKTASQIADEVLCKVAISPEMAMRALSNRVKNLAQMGKDYVGYRPEAGKELGESMYNLIGSTVGGNSRAALRAAQTGKFNISPEYTKNPHHVLSKIRGYFDDLVRNSPELYSAADAVPVSSGIPRGYFGLDLNPASQRNPAIQRLFGGELKRQLKTANMPLGGTIGMPGNRGAAAGQRMMAAGAQGPKQATMPNKVPSMESPIPGPANPR